MPEPIEVTIIEGGNGDDLLVVDQAIANALNAGNLAWCNEAHGHGGNDVFLRDRTGDYDISGGEYDPVYLYGGAGTDTVSYAWLGSGVVADLGFGGVWQLLPDNAWAGQVPFAVDRVFEFERFVATAHDDHILGADIAEGIWGHDGDDTVSGAGGNDTLSGGLGEDDIDGGGGSDTLHGEDGDDMIAGGAGNDTIYGGDGNDEIEGGVHDDLIYAGAGDDDINAGSGSDTVYLDDGDDTVYGGSGNDVIHVAGSGDHDITGGLHFDTVVFGNGATTVDLNNGFAIRADGFDSLTGVEGVRTGSSNDVITGSNGANVIKAGSGVDVVLGLNGNDEIHGENGNDNLRGDSGNDTVLGGSGNDKIDGGSGHDSIDGGSGADRIRGGVGEDTVAGGTVADVFIWNFGDQGTDYMTGFNLAEDKLSFGAGFFAAGPISQVLEAWGNPYGAALWADTSWGGWQQIAWLADVDGLALDQKITNGTIFDVETVFDGPGGYVPLAPGFEPARDADFLL